MLRQKNWEWEVDRELTWKIALEWNYKLQEKIRELEEKNRKLKKELKYRHGIADILPKWKWHIAEETIKDLQKEIKELESDLEHRDSFFSIMRDVLANETITNSEIATILYCVIHYECWDTDMSKKEVEIAEKFWFRDYV